MTQTSDLRPSADPALSDPALSDPWRPADTGAAQAAAAPGPVPPTGPGAAGGGRRPGWGGVLTVGVGSALLASALTAGTVIAVTDRGTTSTGTTSTGTSAASVAAGSAAPRSASQAAAPVTGGTTSPDWAAVAATVEPSVVSVRVEAGNGSGDEGSGVVLDTKGHVLTNNHVVTAAGTGGSISVVLADGRTYAATGVGADPATDLAVLVLTSPPSGLTPATFADSATVTVGQPVLAAGNPLGLADTVTTGIVSALNRPVTTSAATSGAAASATGSGRVVTNAIQTDAAINPGNSGGALVDSRGRVIGITSSIASLGTSGGQAGNIGLGFAIPSNAAKTVAAQLISTGSVKHAYLGVSIGDGTVTVDGAQRQAAVIGTVTAGTPAADAGLQAKDAVVALDGRTIGGAESLIAQVGELTPGTSVKLTVVHSGQTREVTITVAARPTN
jgi:putative serine protease PepD